MQELSEQQIMVVGGLAFGIDTIAHKAAVRNGLPTVGVVGHGLDTIIHMKIKAWLKKWSVKMAEYSLNLPVKHNQINITFQYVTV